ncbi:MAG TPA: excinuclease ABC subunit UvrC [Candidatus Accumulibacter phosphatis]|nr:MAG: Excinuclease ABC subunit C [Candidatus Accumulibacter sp. SK-11]HRL76936.1 excinuclease ABC subunit UvrC [Candidatus Accumulibacter phosphatis]HRQ95310.1 excinuclease ABC subunit UvrC [Candidatus Accumulibacter phosphatis]
MTEAFDAKSLLATLTDLPGVYRMIDGNGEVLYVGKAKNLRKRVASYFREHHPSPRIALMVARIASVETTVTRSEAEALLLENNLIKSLAPRYNILFRDDKSYPYIVLTNATYPQLAFFRGTTDRRADYFGPFPSSVAVRESIHLLQKMFRLRTCDNAVFNNRSRPCLLYQIRRCSAPCVGLIDAARYADDVRLASMFLQGRQRDVIDSLTQLMDAAASRLAFEQAAVYRDQIQSLRQVQEKQYVESGRDGDVDIVAAVAEDGLNCVNLAMVRGGRHLGDRPQFPANAADSSPLEALTAFLYQHYLAHPMPPRILLNLALPDGEVAASLAAMAAVRVRVSQARFTVQRIWVEMAEQNARLAITARRVALSRQEARLDELCRTLGLEVEPGQEARIECFDISHTQGECTVASCVVYQGSGMRRSEYRRFNIADVQAGDDCAAIRQAVQRRYEKLSAGEGVLPTLVLIDGGSGQVGAAAAALEELGLSHLPLLGVAKGEARKPGLETLVFADARKPLQLPPGNPALHLIQEIRDEAHRFAVTGHRARRGKAGRSSSLDEISGIGPKRRKALIARFGGLQGISDAGVDQLTAVPGISRELAEKIYAALH